MQIRIDRVDTALYYLTSYIVFLQVLSNDLITPCAIRKGSDAYQKRVIK